MKIDAIWKEVEKCQTYEVDKVLEIMWVAASSPHSTFGDLQPFLEKWDVSSIEIAMDNIEWIPSMEEGEEEMLTDEYRYDQSGNIFRELSVIVGIKQDLWKAARPKKKKFF